MKFIEIKSAKYLNDYKIEFVFNDKSIKTIDFASFILNHKSPHVTPYKDKNLFSDFEIINGVTISWNDYDMCFGVDDLYKGDISIPDHAEFIKKSFSKKQSKKLLA